MNIVDSVIIGVSLASVLIVIVVITRSFKRVDKKIIQDIQNSDLNEKKKVLTKLKRSSIFLLEWITGKLKRGIQKIHFWTLREKKRDKSELAKAKNELVIDNNKEVEVENIGVKKIVKKSKPVKKVLDEGSVLDKISLQEKDVVMDSVVQSGKGNENVNKSNFIKGLFKNKSAKKRSVDIKQGGKNSSEKWSLEDTFGSRNKKRSRSITKKDVLGVDRKILEKKILQRINKDPVSINNYHELGALYIKMKKYDDAMEVFGYILGVKPDDTEARRRQDKIKLLKSV
jgi:hypothetical protein